MGGSNDVPAQPKTYYTARDGTKYEDANRARERDRQLELAAQISGNTFNPSGYVSTNNGNAAMAGQSGFDPEVGGTLENWAQKGATPEQRALFDKYNANGATRYEAQTEERAKADAAKAAQEEADRKAAITSGRASVDNAFGAYDDGYFGDIAKTMMAFYQPQIDDQYKEAGNQLTYKLARQGISKSTAAVNERAKLEGDYSTRKAEIQSRAGDAVRSAKDNVAGAKNTLYNYAETAADPAKVSAEVINQTGRLNSFQPELTPLGKIFNDYATPVLNAAGTALAGYSRGGSSVYGSQNTSKEPVKRT